MRSEHVLCRCGIVAVVLMTVACNDIIGVDDVSLVSCDVNPDYGLVASNPTTSLLNRRDDGGANLLLLLNTGTRPDSLGMMLYDNMGGHGILNAPGTYSLTAADAKLATCGLCLFVYANYDGTSNTFSQTYLALAQGSLTLTTASSTQMVGHMQNLKFRHVDLASGTTEIDDGCTVTVEDVRFDLSYSP